MSVRAPSAATAFPVVVYALLMAVWIYGPLTESHSETFVSAMWAGVALVHIGAGLLLRQRWSFLIVLIPLVLSWVVGVIPRLSDDLVGPVPNVDGGVQSFFVVAPFVPFGAFLVAVASWVGRRRSRARRSAYA